MNTFKRKALCAAVLAGLGAAGTAEAVYLNPNNTGQVLVYPYYATNVAGSNAWQTYISVVNTTTRAKAVKVRVLEGRTSSEVLDFNLFLSPNDVWVAVIAAAPGTETNPDAPARMFVPTDERSCTSPVGNLPQQNGGEPFRNFEYAESAVGADLPGIGLDRTREGYVEIIEMGVLSGAAATAVTHVNGVPANCAVVQAASFDPVALGQITPPTGGLMGTGTLINVNNGQDATYKADALENWSATVQYSGPGSTRPNIADANPAVSIVVNAGGIGTTGASTQITAYRSDFGIPGTFVSGVPVGARAVASVYMHTAVMNEYVLDAGTGSLTDWVITQPVKHPHFVTDADAAQPYTNVLTTDGACETVSFTFFDREERSRTASGTDFSPAPPDAPANSLCWESTVLSIRHAPGVDHTQANAPRSAILASRNVTNIEITSTFQNGWAELTFTGAGASAQGMGSAATDRVQMNTDLLTTSITGSATPVTFFGLPVTGFMVRTFSNGTVQCAAGNCQGNYGGLFQHSYRTRITP